MKNTTYRVLGLALLPLLWAALAACPEPPPEPETVIRPVRTLVVSSTQESATRIFSGVASAGLASSLSFRVPGNIETLEVEVGDAVVEGQLIAQLDTSDFEVQLQQAQADVSAARAQQRNAEAEYERIQSLYVSGAASLSDLDSSRAAKDSTRAQVSAARQRVRQVEDQINYCTLQAPMDGQIASVAVEVNEHVTAGRPVVVLTSLAEEQLEVNVDIPETVISRLRRGMPATVTFDALPGRSFAGSVTEVGVTAGAATFPVVVMLEEVDPDIRAGMAASVSFTFDDIDEGPQFWLPPHAVQGDASSRFVFVVDPAEQEGLGVTRRQPVTVGDIDNRGLHILEGLSDGDRVVTAGVTRIVDGQTVRLPQPESE